MLNLSCVAGFALGTFYFLNFFKFKFYHCRFFLSGLLYFFVIFQTNCSLDRVPVEIVRCICKSIILNAIANNSPKFGAPEKQVEDYLSPRFKGMARDYKLITLKEMLNGLDKNPEVLFRCINSQNGALINFDKKRIDFPDLLSLLQVSQTMYSAVKVSMPVIYEYWFKKRTLLMPFAEAHFQCFIKLSLEVFSNFQTSYVKIRENFMSGHFDYNLLGSGSEIFTCATSFFICFSCRHLLNKYSDCKGEPYGLELSIFNAFSNERNCKIFSQKKGRLDLFYARNLVFLIASSLGFLIHDFDIENIKAVEKDFLELKKLFNELAGIDDPKKLFYSDDCSKRKALLDSINFNFDYFSNNFYANFDLNVLVPGIEAIIKTFFGFNKILTDYDQKYYKNFITPEKKIIFLYYKLMLNQKECQMIWDQKPLLNDKKIWQYIWQTFSGNIKARYPDICKNDLVECSHINPLLSVLLSLYEIKDKNLIIFFKNCKEIDAKIGQLYSLHSNISSAVIAKNFCYLLENDWQQNFESICESCSSSIAIDTESINRLLIQQTLIEARIQQNQGEYERLYKLKDALELEVLKVRGAILEESQQRGNEIRELKELNTVEINRLRSERNQWKKRCMGLLFVGSIFLCIVSAGCFFEKARMFFKLN